MDYSLLNTAKAYELLDSITEYQMLLNNSTYDKYETELFFHLIESIRELERLANSALYNYQW